MMLNNISFDTQIDCLYFDENEASVLCKHTEPHTDFIHHIKHVCKYCNIIFLHET